MSGPRRIEKNGRLYALVVPSSLPVSGVKFLTPDTSPFQCGLMEHPNGHTIRAHSHAPHTYDIHSMSEFLYVERGKVCATIYDEEWNVLATEILATGDALLLLAGGHGFEVLESCRMLEVKQGPYRVDEQAKVFRS